MGTTYYYELHTKAQAVAYLTDAARLKPYTLLDHACPGNNLWMLVQHPDGHKIIALELLSYSRADNCWGHKSLDESMGPNAADCPLRLLDAASPAPSAYAQDWRVRVRQWHAADAAARTRRKSLAPGVTITLYGMDYRLDKNIGRKGWQATRVTDGMPFRIKATQIKDAA